MVKSYLTLTDFMDYCKRTQHGESYVILAII
jgi:hypothetical protein